MTEAQFTITGLMVLIFGCNVFWAWHSHLLVNKLMSRNFFEYTEALKPKKKTVASSNVQYQPEDYAAVSEIIN